MASREPTKKIGVQDALDLLLDGNQSDVEEFNSEDDEGDEDVGYDNTGFSDNEIDEYNEDVNYNNDDGDVDDDDCCDAGSIHDNEVEGEKDGDGDNEQRLPENSPQKGIHSDGVGKIFRPQ